MEEIKLIKCTNCDKEVPDHTINRFGECLACQNEERDTNMTVGDLNSK